MAFSYDPKAALDCLPEGEYESLLHMVEEKTSAKGHPMLAITWIVPWNGKEWRVRDWIVNPATLYKLKKIAICLGHGWQFEDGTFDLADFIGRCVRLNLDVETSIKFGDQNRVNGYSESAGLPPTESELAAAPSQDEDVPF